MIKRRLIHDTKICVNESIVGETIEEKVFRIVNNKDAIDDGAPLLFSERDEGVLPEYDIRTDRWEIAAEAQDKLVAAKIAKSMELKDTVRDTKSDVSTTETPKNGNSETVITQ